MPTISSARRLPSTLGVPGSATNHQLGHPGRTDECRLPIMRDDHVVQIVEKYIDAVRRNDPRDLPLHPEVVGMFPLNTYRGAESFIAALEPFSRLVKKIDVIRLVADGEHCVAILNIHTAFGLIPFAEHIHVVNGQIVSVQGFYDPRQILAGATSEGRGKQGEA